MGGVRFDLRIQVIQANSQGGNWRIKTDLSLSSPSDLLPTGSPLAEPNQKPEDRGTCEHEPIDQPLGTGPGEKGG